MSITTEKELGEALKNRQDTLEIEGDLKTKVLRIKATGRVAWGLVFVLLAAAILIFLGTGGVALPASGVIGGGRGGSSWPPCGMVGCGDRSSSGRSIRSQ